MVSPKPGAETSDYNLNTEEDRMCQVTHSVDFQTTHTSSTAMMAWCCRGPTNPPAGDPCHVPSTMPSALQTLSQLILKPPREADLMISSIKSVVQGKTTSRCGAEIQIQIHSTSKPVLFSLYWIASPRRPCPREFAVCGNKTSSHQIRVLEGSLQIFCSSFTNADLEGWRILVTVNQWLFFIFCMRGTG